MAVYAMPRATLDIDMMMQVDSLDTAARSLEPLGFAMDSAPMEFHGGEMAISGASRMKIEMTPEAIARRLNQVSAVRRLCLSLARSSAGRTVLEKHPANEKVKRTLRALGG